MTVPEDFSREFATLYADDTVIPVHATRYAWWALVLAVQLASRHPAAAESPVLGYAVELAHGIGDRIADTPALVRVMAEGWDAERDT